MKKKHFFAHYIVLGFLVASLFSLNWLTGFAQDPIRWPPQQRIPGYADDMEPPVMIADQNQTVHALAAQRIDDDDSEVVITYNQWTLKNGWTKPNDILLSPLKNSAQIASSFLDTRGTLHAIFLGGDNTEAKIYYTNASIAKANQAPAWLEPVVVGEDALTPVAATLSGDDKGNMIIVYRGKRSATETSLYATYSNDWGVTWTDPIAIFSTYSRDLSPLNLQTYLDQSGWLHATWNVISNSGQGRQIYYANCKMGEMQWSEPFKIAEAQSGYGVLLPTVIAAGNNDILVLYYETPKVAMRRSNDGGQTWSPPSTPFRQIGVNGKLALVKDAGNHVHLLWGQRIAQEGSDPIHGMWHSVWQGDNRWSEPEAVVSGPLVNDAIDNTSFDPYGAQAIISQGNKLLVTWRSDPGPQNKPNGIWYSYATLNVPELPVEPLPIPVLVPKASPTPTAAPTPTVLAKTQSITIPATGSDEVMPAPLGSPLVLIMIALVPAILIVLLGVLTNRRRRYD